MNGHSTEQNFNMKKSKIEELLQVDHAGVRPSNGWATLHGFTSTSLEDDFSTSFDRHYIVDCRLTLGSRHVVSETAVEQSSIDILGHVRHQAAKGIFQELYGKIVNDLVRYRHLVYSGQMDRTEAVHYIDNMIKDLES